MAEREGFEPSVPVTQYARLAIWCLRPLGHLSAHSNGIPAITAGTHFRQPVSLKIASSVVNSTFVSFSGGRTDRDRACLPRTDKPLENEPGIDSASKELSFPDTPGHDRTPPHSSRVDGDAFISR